MSRFLYSVTAKVKVVIAADSVEEAIDKFVDEHGYTSDIETEVLEEREVDND
jgi:hypothetical protein